MSRCGLSAFSQSMFSYNSITNASVRPATRFIPLIPRVSSKSNDRCAIANIARNLGPYTFGSGYLQSGWLFPKFEKLPMFHITPVNRLFVFWAWPVISLGLITLAPDKIKLVPKFLFFPILALIARTIALTIKFVILN